LHQHKVLHMIQVYNSFLKVDSCFNWTVSYEPQFQENMHYNVPFNIQINKEPCQCCSSVCSENW